MISLTDEQRDAVHFEDNLQLTACPGSGKTRVILAKLLLLADAVVGTPQSIGCITYTNAAVDEIEQRLRLYGTNASAEKCEVATIHSFCLQFIVRPYQWLLPEIPAKFQILTSDMNDFEQIVTSIEDEIGRRPLFQTFLDYESLRIDIYGNPAGSGIEKGSVTERTARRYWELVRGRGCLDFSMIIYYAWKILREHPFVGRGIAAKFKWLLVDEFQDTTDLQLAIFRELHQHLNTNFFFVGDENQSILSFAGAQPDLAHDFARDIGADTNHSLSINFRSSDNIVGIAEALIPTNPGMQAGGENRAFPLEPQYVHTAAPVDAITDFFLPMLEANNIPLGKAAVLAPWWTHLIPIARRLREYDVPVFGPGARPYKRKRTFAGLAEQLGACAEIENLLGLPAVEKSVFRLISDITSETRFDIFTYAGRRSALKLVYRAKELADGPMGGADWLTQMATSAGNTLVDDGWLPESARTLLAASAQDMLNDMQSGGVDLTNLQVSDLGLFANPNEALKLITMHNSKGREFDAVAMICMNKGHIPHFTCRTQPEFDEAKRLFYVGITRAKKVLLIGSDATDRRNPPTAFIGEAGL
ncbi:ATP-dependent helicase [Citromicrobium bathyomarinum]|uniref:ATP-dependent helicase n=2 Tax=Sphingomonadales TaxID=204457 RepID=UPI00315A88F9